jgi:hypothetical protein
MDSWLLRRLLLALARRLVGNELLLDFVWMQETRLLAVGFVNFVLVRRGRNAQEIVECYSWPFGKFDFIT